MAQIVCGVVETPGGPACAMALARDVAVLTDDDGAPVAIRQAGVCPVHGEVWSRMDGGEIDLDEIRREIVDDTRRLRFLEDPE